MRKRRLPGCVPAQGVGDPPNRRTVGSAPIVDVVLLRCRAPMEARLTDTTERLFIAAELPPSVVEEIAARQAGLRQLVSALRFEPATLMHLTLCFVGATVASRIPLFISALLSALARKSVRSKLTSQRFARSPRSLLCALFVSASRAPKRPIRTRAATARGCSTTPAYSRERSMCGCAWPRFALRGHCERGVTARPRRPRRAMGTGPRKAKLFRGPAREHRWLLSPSLISTAPTRFSIGTPHRRRATVCLIPPHGSTIDVDARARVHERVNAWLP